MSKKRSRLNGSPEHHATQSGLNFDLSLEEYKQAKALSDKKQCVFAFRRILAARGAEGEAKAHMRESGVMDKLTDSWHGRNIQTAANARTSAWKAFESHCLVGGSLSGVRRRRKSR